VPQARRPPVVADEKKIRALLEIYACPVPFHEIRTRFLGNIATPAMSASPLSVVKNLWGGELPEFESLDAVNELIGVLVNGLWNSLTRHQKRSDPFRLARPTVTPTRDGLAQLALIRRQEIEGFFGSRSLGICSPTSWSGSIGSDRRRLQHDGSRAPNEHAEGRRAPRFRRSGRTS
jgi:hypothetical protein